MSEFARMLLEDAIDMSWNDDAENKAEEKDNIVPITQAAHKNHHHTVRERRRWDAVKKAYTMPICGIRPVQIREMKANNVPGASELSKWSSKDTNQERHSKHSYHVWSREEAKRDRHPKASIEAAMNEFLFERAEELVEEFELDENFVFEDEKLSSYESLNIFEDMQYPEGVDLAEWYLIDEMFDNCELYFTPNGGLYIASPEAFKFACEHQDTLLKLIS